MWISDFGFRISSVGHWANLTRVRGTGATRLAPRIPLLIRNPKSAIRNLPDPSLQAPRMFDRKPCPRLRFQPDLRDRLAGAFAEAVGTVLDLREPGIELSEQIAVLLDQPERELLLVVIRAHIGHVQRQVREVGA